MSKVPQTVQTKGIQRREKERGIVRHVQYLSENGKLESLGIHLSVLTLRK